MPNYLDPYDISQEAVIQLSHTLHSLYATLHDAAPEEFPASVCPCLDCLWHAFRDQFPEGTMLRLGRSRLFPEEPFEPHEARDDAGVEVIEPSMPNWLDLSGIDGLDTLGGDK